VHAFRFLAATRTHVCAPGMLSLWRDRPRKGHSEAT
jgi:hypothetical protein